MGIGRITLGGALLRQQRDAEAERETPAGCDIIGAQASPWIAFLAAARTDLIAEYESLHQTDRAAAIRSELEAASTGTR